MKFSVANLFYMTGSLCFFVGTLINCKVVR